MSVTMRRTLPRSTIVAAATMLAAAISTLPAQALDAQWCKDVHIRFFVGGAEGDAFGTIVYNGAKQA
ncbi:sugar ABC transporter substrate-binding protein, partial [Mesorhizobium kowhaii]